MDTHQSEKHINMNSRTVRELGGEIWAELNSPSRANETEDQNPLGFLTLEMEIMLLDLIMQVLARHEGETIVNDQDLPVTVRVQGT